LVHQFNRGYFLGYPSTFVMIYYWDLDTKRVKTAYSVKFDEAGIAQASLSPNARRLRDALDHRESTDEDVEVQAPAHLDLMAMGSPFTRLKNVVLPVKCTHSTFGILIHDCADRNRAFITGMEPITTGASLRGWKRHYAGEYVVELNGHPIYNSADFVMVCALVQAELSTVPHPTISLTLAPERADALRDTGISPRMHLDQFRPVIHILHEMGEGITLTDTDLPDDQELASTIRSVCDDPSLPPYMASTGLRDTSNYEEGTVPGSKWTRRQLRKLPCWLRWKAAETKQLDSMAKDGMYGPPCKPPPGAIVLRQVWTYLVKWEGTLKARNCCDGLVLKGRGLAYAQHYTACISQPGMRIFWAIVAIKNWVAIGADAVNAFAQSPPPLEPTYVRIDPQMREWLQEQRSIKVDDDDVHPVLCALQGHPESGSLWADKVEAYLLKDIRFTSAVHEPCLYVGVFAEHPVMVGHQVDDFKIAAEAEETSRALITYLNTKITIEAEEGIMSHYNGIDIVQARDYIKIHMETYIDKLLSNHGWEAPSAAESRLIEPLHASAV
jgi:hypothetical protein